MYYILTWVLEIQKLLITFFLSYTYHILPTMRWWWWWWFSCSVVSTSLRPRGLQHARPGFPVLPHLPGLLKLLSVELMMPSNHVILCFPLLFLASSFVFSSSRFSGVPSISVCLVLFIEKWLCIVDWIWHWLEFKMFSFDRYLWWFSLIYYYENRWISLFSLFSILFQILFPFMLLQNIEQSSLCCTIGHCWLSVLNIAVCTCPPQTPSLSLHPLPPSLPPGDLKFIL